RSRPAPALGLQDPLGGGRLVDAAAVPDRPGAVPPDARGSRPGALRPRLRRRGVPASLPVLIRLPCQTEPEEVPMRLRIPCLPARAALALLADAMAHATALAVREGKDSKVVFTSRAPTETFQGKTDRMQGTLTVDPSAVGDSITVHLEVDLASLDTGKSMRNR